MHLFKIASVYLVLLSCVKTECDSLSPCFEVLTSLTIKLTFPQIGCGITSGAPRTLLLLELGHGTNGWGLKPGTSACHRSLLFPWEASTCESDTVRRMCGAFMKSYEGFCWKPWRQVHPSRGRNTGLSSCKHDGRLTPGATGSPMLLSDIWVFCFW